ncbi:NAD(P)H-quinone oxidoreductase subunit 5 [Haloplanus vescus]|uniref:NAD(P)H-quinone oxidoreductase subunit 5 n=1 Tax=Haloplanus vescus TaxID=555874 RepID=A0A1H3ZJV6_9EURY|nr:proton-conducting transporter membrane subunit [Haloplanus vescus]SEA24076.1 NAD(P)H-quinone oxidoreductase subunit 5 [Haloplanus vescus]
MSDIGEQNWVPVVSTYAAWLAFVLSIVVAVAVVQFHVALPTGGLVRVDGLTLVMWCAVTFFSGIVQSFARRYMAASRNLNRFFVDVALFTLAVLTMPAADNVVLFLFAWTGMGLVMADLIGYVSEWDEARAAGRLSRRYFLSGSALLTAGVGLLVLRTGATTITGILDGLGSVSRPVTLIAAGLIVFAALVQSALFPFHRWLLSSMTAPTPSSALMHAGFVNAGGVLLTRFAPLFVPERGLLLVIVVVGAVSALLAQAMLLVQPTYKGRLGCSTVAQMGFMILQCGLGFFAAAVTHLVVHGFYKAYLFLSTGGQVTKKPPSTGTHESSLLPVAAALVAAALGGVVFATLTGKGLDPTETGVFLTVVVTLSVFRAAVELLRNRSLSRVARLVGVAVTTIPTLAVYALVYNAISGLMHDVPAVHTPVAMTPVHWVLLALFVAGHVAVQFGWFQGRPRMYATLLNAAQPDPRTVSTTHASGSRADP